MEFILVILLLLNIERENFVTNFVDIIEINHFERVDDNDFIILDQLIFWNTRLHYNKPPTPYIVSFKPIFDGREELTDEEYNIKERKMNEEFLKKRPHYRGRLPRYIPDFVGIHYYPKYNTAAKKWVLI